jgi:CRP-like cAMP-binding protein
MQDLATRMQQHMPGVVAAQACDNVTPNAPVSPTLANRFVSKSILGMQNRDTAGSVASCALYGEDRESLIVPSEPAEQDVDQDQEVEQRRGVKFRSSASFRLLEEETTPQTPLMERGRSVRFHATTDEKLISSGSDDEEDERRAEMQRRQSRKMSRKMSRGGMPAPISIELQGKQWTPISTFLPRRLSAMSPAATEKAKRGSTVVPLRTVKSNARLSKKNVKKPFHKQKSHVAGTFRDQSGREDILTWLEDTIDNMYAETKENSIIPAYRMNPATDFYLIWSVLLFILNSISVFSATVNIGFEQQSNTGMFVLETITDILCICDIVLKFYTGHKMPNGEISYHVPTISAAYFKGWFTIDCIAATPVDAFIRMASSSPSSLTMQLAYTIRLLKIPLIARYLKRTASSNRVLAYLGSSLASVFRTARLLVGVAFVAHFIACGWIFIAHVEGGYTWEDKYNVPLSATTGDRYLNALHFSVTTITSVGFGDITPTRIAEKVFTVFCVLFAATGFAFFIANVSNIIAANDSNSNMFKEKLRSIAAYMKYRNVPDDLQTRIFRYFEHCYLDRKYVSDTIINDLSAPLRTEVLLHFNREMVERVPFFHARDENFVRSIILRLKPCIYAPGDLIIAQGDLAKRMYFIKHGCCEVVSGDGKHIYNTLNTGQFFGEVALLWSGLRTASVRAVTYCDIFSLSKQDFEEILLDFPQAAQHIRDYAEKAQYTFTPNQRRRIENRWSAFVRAASQKTFDRTGMGNVSDVSEVDEYDGSNSEYVETIALDSPHQ